MKLYTRNRPISKREHCRTNIKIQLAKTYLEELKDLKNDREAKEWLASVPDGLERVLLFLLALDRVKNSV